MLEVYQRARSEASYKAPYFLKMLHESNGYETAIRLIQSTKVSTGFTHLWKRKRLDLTVEALIIQPEWQGLFSDDDLKTARHRLENLYYDFPPDSWRAPTSTALSNPLGRPDGERSASVSNIELSAIEADLEKNGCFDPRSINTARESLLRAIIIRRGQSTFRNRLLNAYKACAVTGETTAEVLEAAHIIPYRGDDTNVAQNGILLRADWHTLFDLGYWTISGDYKILVSQELKGAAYRKKQGETLRLPSESSDHPSPKALDVHRSTVFRDHKGKNQPTTK